MNKSWCCAGPLCCYCMCGICMRCCGTSHQHHIRIAYLIITAIAVFFGLIFLYYGKELMLPWEHYGFNCNGMKADACYGINAVYRETFAICIFYIFMALMSRQNSKWFIEFNNGCWGLKLISISTIFIFTLFIPYEFFDIYKEFARYISIIYLIIQLSIYVDLSYTWSDNWTKIYEQSNFTSYKYSLLFFFSGIFWVISLVTTVLNYYWFSKDTGCNLEVFLITFTLSLGIVYTFISLTNIVEYGSLLTSSIVNLYCVYLCWDGMTDDPNEKCNTWTDAQDTFVEIIIGISIVSIALSYVCFRKREKIKEQSILRILAESILAKIDPNEDEDIFQEMGKSKKLFPFYMFMALASVYLSMLLTNWGSANVTNNSAKTYDE
ncbi:hypothetical protein SteCoe_4975 [Stentor coeruleus]|uniref:Serine incorporator n=1 Tax=Stentor coeruleus TaxID=5963 RepID=A0A1R2CTL2_9CILI|nr:hypothetical protein SteCoe_4975 [Stentor coeruleus]